MKNTIIVLLLIFVVVVGYILYIYKDEIIHRYNKKSWKIKEDVSYAVKEIKEDIKK